MLQKLNLYLSKTFRATGQFNLGEIQQRTALFGGGLQNGRRGRFEKVRWKLGTLDANDKMFVAQLRQRKNQLSKIYGRKRVHQSQKHY